MCLHIRLKFELLPHAGFNGSILHQCNRTVCSAGIATYKYSLRAERFADLVSKELAHF
jgi:hypothetical protein